VVEHVFCPRFTYYSLVLGLRQYEEKRGTVMAGRNLHQRAEKDNPSYVPKKMGNADKLISTQLYSTALGLSGKIDEAYETASEILLVERKYSDYVMINDTLKTQLGLLSLLLEENRHKPVTSALVVFQKSGRVVKEIKVTDELKEFALEKLGSAKRILSSGIGPDVDFSRKCLDCTFKKVCPTGSLYSDP
jgi:CRISPR-associated exonuclease Cas4